MWRLWNKLFGWHYIWVHDCSSHHCVRVSKIGDRLIGNIMNRVVAIDSEGNISGGFHINDWEPLTFSREVFKNTSATIHNIK